MSPVGAFGPGCVNGDDCHPGWPARPTHRNGYCVQCFMALSPMSRKVENDCDPPEAQPVAPLSSAAKHAAFEAYYEARRRPAA